LIQKGGEVNIENYSKFGKSMYSTKDKTYYNFKEGE